MSEAPGRVQALVIGAGPAGLMAAEAMSGAGLRVVVAEGMPTPARKFLMAGKSGLNLTKAEPATAFAGRVDGGAAPEPPGYFRTEDLRRIVEGFGPDEVADWARGLGVELFTGSTGRVFPVGMKASPLLRAWLARLAAAGVDLRTRWRWAGFDGERMRFDTPAGERAVVAETVVLALGGASWPRLGSDAAWLPWLRGAGVEVAPFRPANMGFRVDWSEPMARHAGQAVKGTALTANGLASRGEWVVTAHGIEGGGIYEISAALRDGAAGYVDLAPGVEAAALAALVKRLPLQHAGPMGLDRAISSAGGVTAASLSPGLELLARPGTFVAGEMIDWEAPTGGYLLTTCLATGRHAGRAAARRLCS